MAKRRLLTPLTIAMQGGLLEKPPLQNPKTVPDRVDLPIEEHVGSVYQSAADLREIPVQSSPESRERSAKTANAAAQTNTAFELSRIAQRNPAAAVERLGAGFRLVLPTQETTTFAGSV